MEEETNQFIQTLRNILDHSRYLSQTFQACSNLAEKLSKNSTFHSTFTCKKSNCICRTYQHLAREVALESKSVTDPKKGVLALALGEKSLQTLIKKFSVEKKLSIDGKDFTINEAAQSEQHRAVALQFLNFSAEEVFGDPLEHFSNLVPWLKQNQAKLVSQLQIYIESLLTKYQGTEQNSTSAEQWLQICNFYKDYKDHVARECVKLRDVNKLLLCALVQIVCAKGEQASTDDLVVADINTTVEQGLLRFGQIFFVDIATQLGQYSKADFEESTKVNFSLDQEGGLKSVDFFLPSSWRQFYIFE